MATVLDCGSGNDSVVTFDIWLLIFCVPGFGHVSPGGGSDYQKG